MIRLEERDDSRIFNITLIENDFSQSTMVLLPGSYIASLCFSRHARKRAEPAQKPLPPPPFEFLGAWGEKGTDPGKLDQPAAFAIDATNRVLFVDPAAEFVDKFETNGTPLLSFQDSRLRHASGITIDSGGAIYVADATHGIVMIFFPDGTFLRSVGTDAQPHFSGPLGIAVDSDGNLYVLRPRSLPRSEVRRSRTGRQGPGRCPTP